MVDIENFSTIYSSELEGHTSLQSTNSFTEHAIAVDGFFVSFPGTTSRILCRKSELRFILDKIISRRRRSFNL
ncbi:hypothetical protein LENED_006420 [Lentinula edodes]|uniref:Uncharacterized protein n=1 Tax=Lentinula edodes TaxID=5353 RepID=A0A1Q3EBL9_LENED|nr:hypothetical protein LENED_006420 [Lentinula edodes]